MELKEALRHRRTYYKLGGGSPVSDEYLRQLVELTVSHVPSAFNSQTSRLALLLGSSHQRLWNIVKDTLRPLVPPAEFGRTEQKIDTSFASGHGTVLFFEDTETVQALQQQFPVYATSFPIYAEHTSAMHQLTLWMLLEEAGLGASLQHYNPLIDQTVCHAFALPATWRLVAQMPFGEPLDVPGDKTFRPLEERVRVLR